MNLDLSSSSQLNPCSSEPNDRLSCLPDELLFALVSLLSFKEKAMTSILSNRWLKLWLDTPVLTFHSPLPKAKLISSEECLCYVSWVNRVLQHHMGRYLTDFEIVCDLDNHYQEYIDNWIRFALSRNVQYLRLNLLHRGYYPKHSKTNYRFPDQLAMFSTGTGRANLNGGQFDLKCLKYLSLKSVDVTGETISLFLLRCPNLEGLEVEDTQELVNLEISGPTLALKYLKIDDCFGLKVLSISNFNLVSLETLLVGDLTLTGLPMLVELSISKKFGLSLSHSFSQVISCYSQLETLTLNVMEFEDIIGLSNLDRLTKLKQLTMEVITYGDESFIFLISIVNSCPCLKEFTMKLVSFGKDNRAIIEVERNSSSPKNQTLKVFEFVGYRGHVSNVELVSHLVENAACLEKIIIDPYRRQAYNDGETALSMAKKQVKALRNSGSIPPHVQVVIRDP